MKPFLSASVLYTNPRGQELAAVVTQVYAEEKFVDLTAFPPGLGHPPTNHVQVPFGKESEGPFGYWSWPESQEKA